MMFAHRKIDIILEYVAIVTAVANLHSNNVPLRKGDIHICVSQKFHEDSLKRV